MKSKKSLTLITDVERWNILSTGKAIPEKKTPGNQQKMSKMLLLPQTSSKEDDPKLFVLSLFIQMTQDYLTQTMEHLVSDPPHLLLPPPMMRFSLFDLKMLSNLSR